MRSGSRGSGVPYPGRMARRRQAEACPTGFRPRRGARAWVYFRAGPGLGAPGEGQGRAREEEDMTTIITEVNVLPRLADDPEARDRERQRLEGEFHRLVMLFLENFNEPDLPACPAGTT